MTIDPITFLAAILVTTGIAAVCILAGDWSITIQDFKRAFRICSPGLGLRSHSISWYMTRRERMPEMYRDMLVMNVDTSSDEKVAQFLRRLGKDLARTDAAHLAFSIDLVDIAEKVTKKRTSDQHPNTQEA